MSLAIFYPNGQVEACLMYIWDVNTLSPVVWDGSLTTGTITIGTVDQGSAGSDPWLITGNVTTTETSPTTIINGHKTIASAGSQAAIASSTVVQSVTVKALTANTGLVFVGDSSVDSATGFQLRAGESVSMDISNLNIVFIDVSVNGEGASWIAVN